MFEIIQNIYTHIHEVEKESSEYISIHAYIHWIVYFNSQNSVYITTSCCWISTKGDKHYYIFIFQQIADNKHQAGLALFMLRCYGATSMLNLSGFVDQGMVLTIIK